MVPRQALGDLARRLETVGREERLRLAQLGDEGRLLQRDERDGQEGERASTSAITAASSAV